MEEPLHRAGGRAYNPWWLDNKIIIKLRLVTEKPPVPRRPTSGKFQNRGNLFPSTRYNKLFELDSRTPSTVCDNLLLQSSAADVVEYDIVPHSTPRDVPGYCRRTQSAKARTTNKRNVPHVKSNTRRPSSACNSYKHSSSSGKIHRETESELKVAVIDLTNDVKSELNDVAHEKLLALPCPRDCSNDTVKDVPPMCFTKPKPEKDEYETAMWVSKTYDQTKGSNLQPSVYRLEKNRCMSGSAPVIGYRSAVVLDQFTYKFSAGDNTGDAIVEHRVNNLLHGNRHIPQTLAPLVPWLTHDISQEVIGVDPRTCLVFLPHQENMVDLPEVPGPHSVEEDLPFVRDLSTPRPWKPKKYPHPFNKQPVEEWICKHNSGRESRGPQEWRTIYKTLRLPRMRTAEVVRKEISDLENLLQGEGNKNSNCAMVLYQSEVTALQDMLDVTMDMVPDRLKNPPEPPDRFGLNKVCSDHDTMLEQIRQRVAECRLELADLEVEVGIETERQHFRTRRSSVC